MKILVYGESPTVQTGFGRVIRQIFSQLIDMEVVRLQDLTFFGINHPDEPHGGGWRVYPALRGGNFPGNDHDPYGRQRFWGLLTAQNPPVGFDDFDVLFLLQDHFVLGQPVQAETPEGMKSLPWALLVRQWLAANRPKAKVVQYIPVDSDKVETEWVNWIADVADFPVAYTEHGRRVLQTYDGRLTAKLRVIPHPVDMETFRPLATAEIDAFRRQRFNVGADTPLIVCVNRNQSRKDLPRAMQVFKQVLKAKPDAVLYIHANWNDSQGHDLHRVAQHLQIPRANLRYPQHFQEGVGVDEAILNQIYNAADVVLSTSRGEGWGMTISEALAAGATVMAGAHTSHVELLQSNGCDCGILLPCEDHPVFDRSDTPVPRPLVDIQKAATAIVQYFAQRHPLDRPYSWNARNRCREWEMRGVGLQWQQLLLESVGESRALEDDARRKAQPITRPNAQEHNGRLFI